MKRGQIYYADLSPAVGSEQGGLRPVIIVQNDMGNKHSPTTIVAPLTTRQKHKLPTHIDVEMQDGRKSTILLEQVRVLDKSRLRGKPIGVLKDTTRLDRAIAISLGLAESKT